MSQQPVHLSGCKDTTFLQQADKNNFANYGDFVNRRNSCIFAARTKPHGFVERVDNDMAIGEFIRALIAVTGAMSPYLLLGFLIAGVLHVFVPRTFYAKYLSRNNKLSVLWAALLGVPLPLCSCGVIPTAVGLKNEGASKGTVASFLIATPQTGIDSILATFSLMGLATDVNKCICPLTPFHS